MRLTLLLPLTLAACLLSCSAAFKPQGPKVYQLGDRVTLGHLSYTIFDRQWQNQFGSGIDARVPQNRFYVLRLSVSNSGSADAILPRTTLVDDSGQSYGESNNGDGLTDWIGNTRQISPGQSAQGNLLFDVPPKHYRLRIEGEDTGQSALVDIPLTFDSDVPDVTTPLDPNQIPPKKQD